MFTALTLSPAPLGASTPASEASELPTIRAVGKLAVRSVSIEADAALRFGKLEATIDLAASYDNAFDPADIDVRGRITTPAGRVVDIAGFFYQPYRRSTAADEAQAPLLDAAGEPCWKIRYTPTEVGRHTLRVSVRDRSGQVEAKPIEFQAAASANPGFVRVSTRHGRYFEYDNGTPFFPVGQNLANYWPMLRHSRLLAEAGCNAVRPFMFCHWTWIESAPMPNYPWAGKGHYMRSYGGSAHYNQRIAWIADEFFSRCERDGLRVVVCLGSDELYTDFDGYDGWANNPYNVARGGFLQKPEQFWTDLRARKLYKQRLRYLVARYGYSPAVWAWEFWNERGRETPQMIAWHREMAQYLHEIDPNRRLISTSFWGTNPETNPQIWSIPEIGFTQTHIYDGPSTIRARAERMLQLSPKPHLLAEGGGPPGADVDPEGVEFHNCLWAGALSGAAGVLPWHAIERKEPSKSLLHYAAVERFARQVPWIAEKLAPIPPKAVKVSTPGEKSGFSPVLFVPIGPNEGVKPTRSRFRLEPDGTVAHLNEMSTSLYGSVHAEWANPPTIEVDYPVPGRFVVHLLAAAHAVLEIDMDGKTVLRDESLNKPRHGIYKDFAAEIPAGRHQITLRNAGADWIALGHVLLTNYRDAARHPDIQVHGVCSNRYAALWFHHGVNQWPFLKAGIRPKPIPAGIADISGLADGGYIVQWWDTRRGQATKSERLVASGNVLRLALPPIDSDVACTLRRE